MLTLPRLGVAIVSYNSADVILDCLESLLASRAVALDIVVADNQSDDGTIALLRAWASGQQAYQIPSDCPFALHPRRQHHQIPLDGADIENSPHRIYLIENDVNGGFAAGVNSALAILSSKPYIDRFWILNPDSMVPPDTAHAFATAPEPPGGFALMGGRVLYLDTPDVIQIDGGTINLRTGVTGNLNLGRSDVKTPIPTTGDIDFIMGASMVASRQFYEAAGPMPEDYFLYYEEVDWALQRRALPLMYCPGGTIYHRAGTAIGSPTLGRPASPFSLYFKHRARLRFVRRHFPRSVPFALTYSFAKAAQLLVQGYPYEAATVVAASCGLPPGRRVKQVLSPDARIRAFNA